jgi:hypothetical protein
MEWVQYAALSSPARFTQLSTMRAYRVESWGLSCWRLGNERTASYATG